MPLTAIVGREREAAALRGLLLRPSARLVTLTGPGGVGKTRLAIAVASDLEAGFDSVAFVPLASVGDPEHLLGAGPDLVELLGAAPGLTVLVTSRALLRVSGEHVFTVPPLTLPDPGPLPPASALDRYSAVRLFADRAQAVRPAFVVDDGNAADVVEICRRLDGLPLAIELAAARVTILPPRALLARLTRRLELLTDGAHEQPERLRTLRAGIAWSYDLLSPDEQHLFRRLAVFVGGCTLAAVEAISPHHRSATLDVVAALVDKSLLQQVAQGGGEPRCAMLETVRCPSATRTTSPWSCGRPVPDPG